ncbi:hypothetical protein GCM10027359_08540 [Marilutibacter aestuarii]
MARRGPAGLDELGAVALDAGGDVRRQRTAVLDHGQRPPVEVLGFARERKPAAVRIPAQKPRHRQT